MLVDDSSKSLYAQHPMAALPTHHDRQSTFHSMHLGESHSHSGKLEPFNNTATLQSEAAQTTCWSIQARLPVASTWHDEEPSTVGPQPSWMIRFAKEQFSWCREPVQRCLVDGHNTVLHFPLALSLQREASQY